jgi:hypothetical protein
MADDQIPGPGRTGDTITRDELTAFCVRHRDYGVPTAGAIWDDILAHREPEYEPGEIYRDAIGNRWQRTHDGKSLAPGSSADHEHGYPARPLRRLVPEGPKVDHGQILAELTQWTNLPRGEAIYLAWRICKLIGGECSGD